MDIYRRLFSGGFSSAIFRSLVWLAAFLDDDEASVAIWPAVVGGDLIEISLERWSIFVELRARRDPMDWWALLIDFFLALTRIVYEKESFPYIVATFGIDQ